ncbi:MAG: hypothetical protein SGJ15_11360, partial [Bacteroidota bacterium]|nr:hypothetical protein [Bacteroidota bacterium]
MDLSSINIEGLKRHFKNAINLYIHPIDALKKATSTRKTSYDQIVNYTIYYLVEPQKVFLLFGRLIGLSLQACLSFAMFVALRG